MRNFIRSLLAVTALAATLQAQAVTVSVFDSASLVPLDPGHVELLGFGRGASSLTTPQPALAGGTPFFDTWNVNDDAAPAGDYSFANMVINATGGLHFNSVTFNSYDETGARQTIVFDINADGTQAVGSGPFTVLAQCPVNQCIWIDLSGTQTGSGGYNGTLVAGLVPEPASIALMALGLSAVGVVARRRQRRAAA